MINALQHNWHCIQINRNNYENEQSVINIPFLKKMVDKITKNWSNKPLNVIE